MNGIYIQAISFLIDINNSHANRKLTILNSLGAYEFLKDLSKISNDVPVSFDLFDDYN